METEDSLSVMEARVKVEDPEMWQPPMLVLLPEFNSEDDICDGNEGAGAVEAEGACETEEGVQMVVQEVASLFPVKCEPIEKEDCDSQADDDKEKKTTMPKIVQTMSLSGEHRPLKASEIPPSASGRFPCSCGKMYMHRASLYKHVWRSKCGKVTGKGNRRKGRRRVQQKTQQNAVHQTLQVEDEGANHSGKVGKRKTKLAANGKVALSSNSKERAAGVSIARAVGNVTVNCQDREKSVKKEMGRRREEQDTPVVHRAVNEGALQTGTGWYYCSCGKAFCYNSSLLKHIRVSTERSSLAAEKTSLAMEKTPLAPKRKKSNEEELKALKQFRNKGTVFKKEDKAEGGAPAGRVVSLADVINFCRTGNMQHHLQPDNFECFCGKFFPNVTSLIGHVHGSAKADPWHCLMSGELSQKSDMLSQYSELQNRPQGTVGKYHKCNVCNQWFAFLANLRAHQLTHLKEAESQNKTESQSKSSSQSHSSATLETNDFLSSPTHNLTNTYTKKSATSKVNVMGKGKQKSFQCNICRRRFPLLAHLKSHQRSHEKDKNIADSKYYDCKVCGRRFALFAHLKSHQRVHVNRQTEENVVESTAPSSVLASDAVPASDAVSAPADPTTTDPTTTTAAAAAAAAAAANDGGNVRKQMRLFRKSESQRRTFQQDSPSIKAKTCSKEASVDQIDVQSCKEKNEEGEGLELPRKRARRSSLSLCSSSDTAVSSEEFSCHCGSMIKSSSDILKHIEEHRLKQELCCKECGKIFLEESLYARHCKHHHLKAMCRVCNVPFRFYRDYAVHRLAHWGTISTRCGRCGDKYNVRDVDTITYCCKPCEELLKRCVKEGEEKTVSADVGKDAECKICGSSFQDFGELERHWPSHAGDCTVQIKRIKKVPEKLSEDCQKPGEADSTPVVESTQPASTSDLVADVANDVAERADTNPSVPVPVNKFKCQCQKTFRFRVQFKNHLCEFTQGIPCTVCNKLFRKKARLVQHMRQHTGLPRYKCNLCDQRFSRIRVLKSHKKKHYGEKSTIANQSGDQIVDKTCEVFEGQGVSVAKQEVENSQRKTVEIENCVNDNDVKGKTNNGVSEQGNNGCFPSTEMDNVSDSKDKSEKVNNVEIVNPVEEVADMEKNSSAEILVSKELESSFEGAVDVTFNNTSCKGIHIEEECEAYVNEKSNCDPLETDDGVGINKTENGEKALPLNISKDLNLCATSENPIGGKSDSDSLKAGDGVGNGELTVPSNNSENTIVNEECADGEDVMLQGTLVNHVGEKGSSDFLEAQDNVGINKIENCLPNLSNSLSKEECANGEDVTLCGTFENPLGEKEKCDSLQDDSMNVNDVDNVHRRHFAVEKSSKDEKGNEERMSPADNITDKDGENTQEADGGKFSCNVCWKVFADSESLQVHKHVWGNVPCNLNQLQPVAQKRLSTVVNEDYRNKDKLLKAPLNEESLQDSRVPNCEQESACPPPVKTKYKCSACNEFFYHPNDLKTHRCARKSRQLAIRYEITHLVDSGQRPDAGNKAQIQVVDHMTAGSSNEFVTNQQPIVLDEMADSNQVIVPEDSELIAKQISVASGHKLLQKSLSVGEKIDVNSVRVIGGHEFVKTSKSIVTGQMVQVNCPQIVSDKPFVSDQESVASCHESDVNKELAVGSNEKDMGQKQVIIYQPIIIPTIVPMIVNSPTSWGT